MSKKILSILLVVSMLVSMFAFISVLAEGEVLLSYSFEAEDEGWTYWNKKDNQINSLSKEKAKTGNSSLFVNDTSKDAAGGFQSDYIEAKPGKVYSATIDAYLVSAGTTFYLRFYGADKKKYLSNKSVKPASKDKWETLVLSAEAPEGTSFVSILVATNAAGNGVAYYDNAKIISGEVAVSNNPEASGKQEDSVKPQGSIDAGNSIYKTEIEFLSKLGLLDSDFKYSEKTTKAEMAKMIAKAMHPEMDFSKAVDGIAFNDVSSSHAYYSYIKACKDLKIVNGDFKNNFYPDSQVTAVEVMTMIINALGYTPYAEAFGGYPTGYFQVASSTGISKGVNLASSETVCGEVVAKIIYNSLFADLVELSSISNGSVEIKIDGSKNLLSARLGIYEYDAIVIDNGIGSIEGSTIGDTKKAVIKDTKTGSKITAFVCDTNICQYLGYRVKAFIKNNMEEGRNEFVYVAPYKNYETVTINAKDIINKTSSCIEYDEDLTTASSEKIDYNQNEVTIVVNGVSVSGYTLIEVLPTDGFVTFIENDDDSYYDVVNIISFNFRKGDYHAKAKNIIVDDVVTKEGEEAINCIFNPIESLDLNEDKATYIFAMNDEIKSISSLKQYDVVSVGEAPIKVNGKTHYILVANREKKESKLDAKGDMQVVLSDGSEYDLSESLTYAKPAFMNYLQLGKAVTVYLDITGKIAYVKTEGGSSKNYAYIVTAVKRMRAGQEVMLAKIFTKNGEMLELPLSDKVKIDGDVCDTLQKQEDALNNRFLDSGNLLKPISGSLETIDVTGRPAIIDIKDGKITRIDTDTPNSDLPKADEKDISKDYSTQSLIEYSDADASSFETLKAGFRNPRQTSIFGSYRSVEGKFFVTGDTTIIAVPEIDTYGISNKIYNGFTSNNGYAIVNDHIKLFEIDGDEFFKVMAAKDIKSEISYDIQGYDIDPDTGAAGLVVLRGRSDIIAESNNKPELHVFSKITDVYDVAKEKTVKKIYYYDENLNECSALVDLETAFYPIKYAIEGLNGNGLISDHNKKLHDDYPTSHIVNPLASGDLIRITTDSDGYVVKLERIIQIKEYKSKFSTMGSNTVPCTKGYSNDRSYGTATSLWMQYASKRGAGYDYGLGIGYPSDMTGSVLNLYVSCNNKSLGEINLASHVTYTNMFVDVQNIEPYVITYNASKEAKVEKGSYDDLITVMQAENDIDKASLVVFTSTTNKMKYVYIINGLENIML